MDEIANIILRLRHLSRSFGLGLKLFPHLGSIALNVFLGRMHYQRAIICAYGLAKVRGTISLVPEWIRGIRLELLIIQLDL